MNTHESQPATNAEKQATKTVKFYEKLWFRVIMFFLFWPLALALFIFPKHRKKSCVFAVLVFGAIFAFSIVHSIWLSLNHYQGSYLSPAQYAAQNAVYYNDIIGRSHLEAFGDIGANVVAASSREKRGRGDEFAATILAHVAAQQLVSARENLELSMLKLNGRKIENGTPVDIIHLYKRESGKFCSTRDLRVAEFALVADFRTGENLGVIRLPDIRAREAVFEKTRVSFARRILGQTQTEEGVRKIIGYLSEEERAEVEGDRAARMEEIKQARLDAVRAALPKAQTEQEVNGIVAALPEAEQAEVENDRAAKIRELRISAARVALNKAITEQQVGDIVASLPDAERADVEDLRSACIVELRAAREARLRKAREMLSASVTENDVSDAMAGLRHEERAEIKNEHASRLAQVKADQEVRVAKARDALKTAPDEEVVGKIVFALPATERGLVEVDKFARIATITKERAERDARAAKARAAFKNAKTQEEVEKITAALPESERPLVEKERVGQIAQILFMDSLQHPKTVLLPGGVALEMQPIPAGTFMMGNPESKSNYKWSHGVTLTKPFLLGKYEVTQEQWLAVMGDYTKLFLSDEKTAKNSRNDNIIERALTRSAKRPMNYVAWNDAMQFCQKLTELEQKAGRLPQGWRYILPTEAQWEYACRAGTTSDYGGSGNLDEMGWWSSSFGSGSGNSNKKLHEVGLLKANHWGLYDMHGNVAEWCLDWREAYPNEDVIDPLALQNSEGAFGKRVVRGGSAFATLLPKNADDSRKSHGRIHDYSVDVYPSQYMEMALGFRVALSFSDKPEENGK